MKKFINQITSLAILAMTMGNAAVTASPLVDTRADAVVKRDSHGCYGVDADSKLPTHTVVSLALEACDKIGAHSIADGQSVGVSVPDTTGHYVYVGFTSSKNGWYVDANFCKNSVQDVIGACDKSGYNNGGYWHYDGQGTTDVDTGPDN